MITRCLLLAHTRALTGIASSVSLQPHDANVRWAGSDGVCGATNAQAAGASAAAGSNVLVRVGGWLLQGLCAALPGAGSAAGCMAAAAGLLLATAAVAILRQRLRKLEATFLTGSWPPPRNTSSAK